MIVTSLLFISFAHILHINGENFNQTESIFPIFDHEFGPEMISRTVYNKRQAECQKAESNVLQLERQLKELQAQQPAEQSLAKERANILIEMKKNNATLGCNITEEQTLRQQLKDVYKQNRQLQKDVKNLTRETNTTDHYLYQFKWKILVKQVIDDYEEHFDKLHLRYTQPPFECNETALNQTCESWKYDNLAELRRQRWEFHLKTPPYCDDHFNALVKRIKESKFTVEKFCRTLAAFYKVVSFDSHFEIVNPSMIIAGYFSNYQKMNFIVPLLLADYPRTKLIEVIFSELESGKPSGIN